MMMFRTRRTTAPVLEYNTQLLYAVSSPQTHPNNPLNQPTNHKYSHSRTKRPHPFLYHRPTDSRLLCTTWCCGPAGRWRPSGCVGRPWCTQRRCICIPEAIIDVNLVSTILYIWTYDEKIVPPESTFVFLFKESSANITMYIHMYAIRHYTECT